MNDKEQKMWEWLTRRIVYAMGQGLTEQHCMDAVTEADKILTDVRDNQLS